MQGKKTTGGREFLKNAYHLEHSSDTRALYKDWAASYDEEVSGNGYISPQRITQALLSCGAPTDTPVLDIGCGSGVSGLFLKDAGFATLDGADFSPEMLARAKEKGIYRHLYISDLRDPFDFIKQPYKVITAVGVFVPGHAEPTVMSTMVTHLETGGLFGFTLNDHTLAHPEYLIETQRLVTERQVRIRWQDYGDHLPGIGLNAMIMVLEKIC